MKQTITKLMLLSILSITICASDAPSGGGGGGGGGAKPAEQATQKTKSPFKGIFNKKSPAKPTEQSQADQASTLATSETKSQDGSAKKTRTASESPADTTTGGGAKAAETQSETRLIKVAEDSFHSFTTSIDQNYTMYSDGFSGCLGIIYVGTRSSDQQKEVIMGHFNKNNSVFNTFMKKINEIHQNCSEYKIIIFCHQDIEHYMNEYSKKGNLSKKITLVRKNLLARIEKANLGNLQHVFNLIVEQYHAEHPGVKISKETAQKKMSKISSIGGLKANIDDKLWTINRIIMVMHIQKALNVKGMIPKISYEHSVPKINPNGIRIFPNSTQKFGLCITTKENEVKAFSYLDCLISKNTIYSDMDSGMSRFIKKHRMICHEETAVVIEAKEQRNDFEPRIENMIASTLVYTKRNHPQILENHGGSIVRQIL